MAKKTEIEVTDANSAEILAKVVLRDDGYHVIDNDGTEGPVCNRRTTDGYIILTPNASNRKCVNEKNAAAYFAENPDGFIPLTYKATRTLGGAPTHIPNEKLISYLPEDLQNEYRAIIDRAIQARNDARSKPMTELEKAQKKVADAQAKLQKLLDEAAGTVTD